MPDRVVVRNDIVEQIYEGDQSYDSVSASANEVKEKLKELREKGKPALVLSDLTPMGQSSSGSRRAAVEALKDMDYDKIALFGGGVYLKHLTNFLIKASGKAKKVKFFSTKEEAIDWLRSRKT